MALAMEFKSGNATIRIMDDFCSAPNQAERDRQIKKRVYANALAAIRANPDKYYALMGKKEKNKTVEIPKEHSRRHIDETMEDEGVFETAF